MSKKNSYLTATDQFCGAGGTTVGVKAAGVEVKHETNRSEPGTVSYLTSSQLKEESMSGFLFLIGMVTGFTFSELLVMIVKRYYLKKSWSALEKAKESIERQSKYLEPLRVPLFSIWKYNAIANENYEMAARIKKAAEDMDVELLSDEETQSIIQHYSK